MPPPKLLGESSQLLLAVKFRLRLVHYDVWHFGWLMSPKRPNQPIPILTSRQSWCISSNLVVYPIGKRKDDIPENLYENFLN